MKKKHPCIKFFVLSGLFLLLFIAFTISLKLYDVQNISPNGESVGYGTINGILSTLLKSMPELDGYTDIFKYASMLIMTAFAGYGAFQLFKTKSFFKVDKRIIAMGVAYLMLLGCDVGFTFLKINYRPILIDGALEASYPSSHVAMVMTVFITACMYIYDAELFNIPLRALCCVITALVIPATFAGRLFSQMHYITDLIGAVLLASFISLLYQAVILLIDEKTEKLNRVPTHLQ